MTSQAKRSEPPRRGDVPNSAETALPAAPSSPAPAKPDEPAKPAPEVYAELNEIQARLLKIIAAAPNTTDELIDKTGLPYAQTTEALTELEILGHIKIEQGGKYTLN